MRRVLLLTLVAAIGLIAAPPNHIKVPANVMFDVDNVVPCNQIRSPGDTVGWTDYDYQLNGSLDRYIVLTPLDAYHFYWTYQYDGTGNNRRASYNYFYPPDYWLGMINPDTRTSRMGSCKQMADGRAVITAHATEGPNIMPKAYVDAGEGYGTFTICDIPYPDPPTAPSWPKPCVNANDDIYIIGTGGPVAAEWTMSTDDGATWSAWSDNLAGVQLIPDIYGTGGCETWCTSGNKMALVNSSDATFTSYMYWESTDNGATWSYDTIFDGSTEQFTGYYWNSSLYDNSGNLHVTFCVIDTAQVGGAYGSGWGSQIRHWNQGTGAVTLVQDGSWTTNPGPGGNHPTVNEVGLAIDRASGRLYSVWCQADAGSDTSNTGWTNMEIYAAWSGDNGATWSTPENITNSHSPGASPGDCEHDWWMSVAEEADDWTIHVFYMNDKDAGSWLQGEGSEWTDNPMLHHAYTMLGIEEYGTGTPARLALTIAPTPVTRNTMLSYALPSAGNVSIKVYSVDGRLVETVYSGSKDAGVYTENIDARQLSSGTYFVILDAAGEQVTQSLVVVR